MSLGLLGAFSQALEAECPGHRKHKVTSLLYSPGPILDTMSHSPNNNNNHKSGHPRSLPRALTGTHSLTALSPLHSKLPRETILQECAHHPPASPNTSISKMPKLSLHPAAQKVIQQPVAKPGAPPVPCSSKRPFFQGISWYRSTAPARRAITLTHGRDSILSLTLPQPHCYFCPCSV